MNIKITDTLYLKSDAYCCWVSQVYIGKKGKSAGKEQEKVIGYYRNPADALVALLGHKMRTSEATTLKELLDAVRGHTSLVGEFVTDRLPSELKKE